MEHKTDAKEIKIEIPDAEARAAAAALSEDKQYTICCSHSSVGFIKYSSAFIISIGILTFSFIMIGMHPTNDNNIFFFN